MFLLFEDPRNTTCTQTKSEREIFGEEQCTLITGSDRLTAHDKELATCVEEHISTCRNNIINERVFS